MDENETLAALERTCAASGWWISGDGRIGEEHAATLLGMAADTLARKRRQGTGPRWFQLGGGGHRISYRLADIAKFIDASGRNPDEPG